ncbi:MAG: PHP domain-containing protein [Firmicutes bacterium]|nr:PHP domain-containing protein [Bacillota bacterium]
MIVADLHLHTQASDGLYAPEEIVRLAVAKKLIAIAITDHDTVDGIDGALEAAQNTGLLVIPGIEFSTTFQDKEIHILGYCLDYKGDALQSLLKELHESRYHRMEAMVQKLKELDYQITMDEVLRQAGAAAPGRPHAARVLVEKGYFPSVAAVFENLLEKGRPAYVKRFKLTPQAAMAAIETAGGFSVWAHPGQVGDDSFLEQFIAYGLRGIEVYHPEHDAGQTEHYERLAKKHGLLMTGGSDFHGEDLGLRSNFANFGLTSRKFDLFKYYCMQIRHTV